jgi:hypothetical protein
MNFFIPRLSKILSYARIPYRVKPEARECILFANLCREASLKGELKAVWFSVTNEYSGGHNPVFGAVMGAMGRIRGSPDYVFLWNDGCACIEMKSQKGKLTPNQKIFKEWCETKHVPYVVCYTVTEAFEKLREWNLISKNY